MFQLERDDHGYPTKGIDVVPERKYTFVQLLKKRNEGLQEQRDSWFNRYHELYQDCIVLKYGNERQQCQSTSKENTLANLQQELIKKDQEIRFWQNCYERVLKQHE